MAYNSLLVDTSFLLSYFIPQDTNHGKAKKLLHKMDNYGNLFISSFIFLEFSTVISQKLGKPDFRKVLDKTPVSSCKEIFVSELLYNKTKSAFKKLEIKNASFVDLNTFILAKEYAIDSVLSFDKHFKYLAKEYKIDLIN